MAQKRWGIWKWRRCAVSNLSHISTEKFSKCKTDLSAFFFFLLLLAVFGILKVNGANQKLLHKGNCSSFFPPLIGFEQQKTLNQNQKLSSRFSSEDWDNVCLPVLFHINNQTMNQPNWFWRTKERWTLTKRISDLSLGINVFMLHSLLFPTLSLAQLLIK